MNYGLFPLRAVVQRARVALHGLLFRRGFFPTDCDTKPAVRVGQKPYEMCFLYPRIDEQVMPMAATN